MMNNRPLTSFQHELLMPTLQESEYLQELNTFYKKFNQMQQDEREFLNAIILRYKPKKLLELGVSAGGSSVIILNAIKNIEDAKLYSIEYHKEWYRDSSKNSGWVVEHYPTIKQKWNLYAGGLAFSVIENIGENIEFALIDTVHIFPGEILDILMILPFLSDNAIVVFHDTNLHTANKNGKPYCKITGEFINNLLISTLYGKKILQGNFDRSKSNCYFSNIAAVQLTKESKERIFEFFNLLTLRWNYMPEKVELQKLAIFFEKYYGSYFTNYFRDVCVFQEAIFPLKIKVKHTIKKYLPKKIKQWIFKLLYGIKGI
jgi:predicted O-methyltransferase YrrM